MITAGKRLGISVPGQAEFVRNLGNGLGQLKQDVFRVKLKLGFSAVEHRTLGFIHDLDSQPLFGDIQQ